MPEFPPFLFLAHRVPYPPDKGDRIRTYHLLRFLARRRPLHLACLADEPVPAATYQALEQLCARLAVIPVGRRSRWLRAFGSLAGGRTISEGAFRVPALARTLRAWASETPYAAALASASSLVPYLRLPELQGVPAVLDLVDVDSQKWLEYAKASRWPLSWLYGIEGRRLRILEQSLPRWAHAITLVSEAEAGLYREACGDGPVYAVPNGVDLDYFQPRPAAAEHGCVFVGALDYRPNVDGICWFCREVWPAVRQARPGTRLVIVGRQPTAAVRALAEISGVDVVGQVPDVRPYVHEAAVAVAPLRLARGIQNKVLEALAMGKAAVASPAALEGLHAVPGAHLLAAGAPEEWTGAVLQLLDDAALRGRLGSAGRRYVEENHRWERCLEPFASLLPNANGSNGTGPGRNGR